MSTVGTKACKQQAAAGHFPFLQQKTLHKHAVDEASALPNDLVLQRDLLSDKFFFAKALSTCSKEKALDKGRSIHALVTIVGFDSDAVVATAVLNVYSKCGILEDAHKTFEGLPKKDVISWNAIIAACAQHGLGAECLHLYADMHQKCILPDKFTCVSMLSACATLEDIRTGQLIHAWWLCAKGPPGEIIVDTALINMYGKCRRVDDARGVFEEMDHHDMISWNAMISGYALVGYAEDAFCLFNKMLGHGMIPNKITIIGILDACVALSGVLEVQSYLLEVGFEVDIVLGSALVNMYCKCSSLHDAFKIFDGLTERNLITWNSMIAGYATQHVEEALKLFDTMQDEGINPDRITWSTVLDAFAGLDSLAEGECIYNCIIRVGLEDDSSVAAAAIKLYGNSGNFDISYTLFGKIPKKSFPLWNTLIMVYAQHGLVTTACELFHDMHESGVTSDSQMFADLLSACAKHVTLSEGRWIHLSAILLAIDTGAVVLNALINMYAKCGCLEDAWFLFDRMPERNVVAWTTMIATYAQFGNDVFAIHLYSKMQREIVFFDKVTFINLLKACSRHEFLSDGRNMHKDITIRGFDLDSIVGNALTDMYGKCGVLDDARSVFDNMAICDVVSWNTMITAYAHHGKLTEGLVCLAQMKRERVIPDEVTFVGMLSVCISTESVTEIRWVHQFIMFDNFESNPSVASALINVYGKWGRLEDAQRVFNRIHTRNVVAWKAMIMGLIEQGKNEDAVQVFVQMQMEGILVDKASYVCTFNAFASLTSLVGGKQLHACVISLGFSQDIVVTTALVSMYGKCCSLEDACILFHEMPEKDEVSWAAMLGAFLESESFAGALQLFERMLEEAVLPNLVVFLNILHACTECGAFTDGCRLHARLLSGLFLSDSKIRNAVLNMYGECGSIINLERFFYELPVHDVTSYNVMIKNYVHAHHPQEALQMFFQMEVEGLLPDIVTSVSCLEACGNLGVYSQGKSVHSSIINSGFVCVIVNNALINMYSKCGHLQEAMEVFTHISERNVASWNAIISAYCQWEYGKKALQMFNLMLLEVLPDNVTFATVLCACTNEEALTYGKLLHNFIAILGFEQEVIVGNSLISMYGKCGGFKEAETVFKRLSKKNTATWNSMIMVDTLQGDNSENVYLLEKMQSNGVIPNEITISRLLDFCASNGAAVRGRLMHMHIILCGLELDVSILTSLVNLYGKCGILKDALSVFKSATNKNSFTWTAMITAYTCLGLGKEALFYLMQMQHKGLVVDRVTLLSIFSACNHAGLLDRGQHFFFQLCYGSMVDLQHLDSVIDLLGRMGQLIEAETLIAIMPFQPTIITWTALVGACRNVGDVGRAIHAAAHVLELDWQNTAACIMLSNMHLAAAQLMCTKEE